MNIIVMFSLGPISPNSPAISYEKNLTGLSEHRLEIRKSSEVICYGIFCQGKELKILHSKLSAPSKTTLPISPACVCLLQTGAVF